MPEKNPLKWSETTAPDGIELPDGRRIDALVVTPDTDSAYGDDESAAQMAGEVAAKRSTDSQAGDRAYGEALEQLDQNFDEVRRVRAHCKLAAREPMVEVYFDRDRAGVLRGFHVVTAWAQPNGKWNKPYHDRPSGRTVYPRIDWVAIDEMDRTELKLVYGVKV
jgi:hypothetical protein